MTRSTLKLPKKSTLSGEADATRSPFRKPLRSGSTPTKLSLSQRAERIAERSARIAEVIQEKERPRFSSSPRPRREDAIPQVPLAPEVKRRVGSDEIFPRPAKAYPKRGIARSTGARAFAPSLVRDESQASSTTSAPGSSVANKSVSLHRPADESTRLSKRISELRQCSRREADEWIENGWVHVDGVVVTTLGARVSPNAAIEIRDEASQHRKESVTILFNKPQGKAGDAAALDKLIRPASRWADEESRVAFKASHLRGLEQVGRLDDEASGMLVFTQENSVVRRITGDDIRLEKEFMVRVSGEISENGLKLLNHGLSLDDVKLRRAQVSWQSEQQLRFVLHENQPRQIQRMCEQVGLGVELIKLIRIGSVSLGKLPAGQWRYLRGNERF